MRGWRARRGWALPGQPGPLIGRERELEAAEQTLATQDVRLLTITGPPGAGKTRLAVAVAAKLASASPDGGGFVDLAPIHDSRLLPPAIRRTAGGREQRGELARPRVDRHIGGPTTLPCFGTFCHLLAAPAA